jgi:hypothetical protein
MSEKGSKAEVEKRTALVCFAPKNTVAPAEALGAIFRPWTAVFLAVSGSAPGPLNELRSARFFKAGDLPETIGAKSIGRRCTLSLPPA